MLVRGRLTTITDDLPVPDGTEGEVRLIADDSLVTTLTTTDGWYEYEVNGSPGPFYIQWDYAGVTKYQYSSITGPSGAVDVGYLPLIFRVFTDGVIAGIGTNLAVTANGSGMIVAVALGASLTKGIPYYRVSAGNVAIAVAHATLPRIDTVVVEVVPPGDEELEGRSEIKVITGTAAASPVAPTLTQTTTLWQMPLANVAVGAAVTVIGSDKITDRRAYAASSIPAGTVTATEMADGSVTSAKILDGTIAQVDMSAEANSIYLIKESGTSKNVVPTNRINFNGDHFDVTLNAGFDGKQIDVALASSGSADILMPGSQFVATGPISSGTRTLITFAVGPLPANVPYAVRLRAGVTLRNQGNTGTVNVRCNINGGTQATVEYQNVGGVPRWAPNEQSATVTLPAGGNFNVTMSIVYVSGDPTDVRAGWVNVDAFPASVIAGV